MYFTTSVTISLLKSFLIELKILDFLGQNTYKAIPHKPAY
jgi:hypothetical protein